MEVEGHPNVDQRKEMNERRMAWDCNPSCTSNHKFVNLNVLFSLIIILQGYNNYIFSSLACCTAISNF